MNRKVLILVCTLFALIAANTIGAYSYWDSVTDRQSEISPIGEWRVLGTDFTQAAIDMQAYIANNVGTYPALDYIYNQAGNSNGQSYVIPNVSINNIVWDISGFGTKPPAKSMGFVQIVDRTGGHPILPVAPTTPESDYFLVSDVRNTNTDNDYSIRMNYGSEMVTDQPITGLTQVSFYASRGTQTSNELLTLVNATLEVKVSVDKINWTTIGTITPSTPSGSSYSFSQFTLDVPANLLGNDLYVTLHFNGEGTRSGNNSIYSRVVIDELNFITS